MLFIDFNIYNMRYFEVVKKNFLRCSKEILIIVLVVVYDIKNFKICFRCNMYVLENFFFLNRWIIY